eukprot:m.221271 g.221271  ORF g.221271 m.221271 type:complete len:207 (+) comp10552_c0_seq1:121-741(+)
MMSSAPIKLAMQARFASTAIVKPQLQLFGVEGRYAHALFSAASKKSQLDAVEKDLIDIEAKAAKDKAFSNFLVSPIQSRQEKKTTVKGLLKGKNELTVNFFSLLAENNRLANTTDIVKAFKSLISSHRGEVEVTVTSSEPLNEKTLKSLKESLAGFAKKGENLKISTKVDPTILGGLVVDVGDKHIDMSIATTVKKYTQLLRQPLL